MDVNFCDNRQYLVYLLPIIFISNLKYEFDSIIRERYLRWATPTQHI